MMMLIQGVSDSWPLWWGAAAMGLLFLAVLLLYGLPQLIRLFQVRRWRSSCPGMMALTYDDGPDDCTTGMLLDLLEERGVRATFYLVGFRAEANAEMLERLGRSGHELGTHTHSHKNAWKKPIWFEYRDAMRGYGTLSAVVGGGAPYRPPFGKVSLLTWLGCVCVVVVCTGGRWRRTTRWMSLKIRERSPGVWSMAGSVWC